MPWTIRGNAVYNKSTGRLAGRSKNPKKFLRALYANVPESRRPSRKAASSRTRSR